MHAPSSWDICLFGRFRVDRRRGILYRRDKRGVFVSLALGSRALGILGVLVERPGELVPRAEIISAVWPETTVEDSNLDVQIAALRRVLDEGRTEGSCILTIRGRGYRFTAPVTRTAEVEAVPIGIALAAAGQAVAGCHAVPENMSGDSAQEYFADGVVEEIITALSRITWLFVIARNSSFTYKGEAVRYYGRKFLYGIATRQLQKCHIKRRSDR